MELKSPGYPVHYFDNITCEWNITVAKHNQILLVFQEFQTEPEYDYLEIYQVIDGNKSLSLNINGSVQVPFYMSSVNNIVINFRTNQMNSKFTGFHITMLKYNSCK